MRALRVCLVLLALSGGLGRPGLVAAADGDPLAMALASFTQKEVAVEYLRAVAYADWRFLLADELKRRRG
ncbi:hypothetical protein D6833_05235 [Candidatus Parcubacteria bacterium]|nr:MAG: hypothetical protein D6833_05235 [Candidatus Parcubacteria bacterium]